MSCYKSGKNKVSNQDLCLKALADMIQIWLQAGLRFN